MRVPLGVWAELYAPFFLYGIAMGVGAVYSIGYRNGMQAINKAAFRASQEGKRG